MTEALMTIGEVRDLFHVHGNTLRRWCNQGLIKTYRIGPRGDRRFAKEDVERFLRQGVQLPEKHVEVLHLIAQGLSNEEIAERLHYSVSTIRGRISTLCRLFDARTRGGLVKILRMREKASGN